MRKLAYPWHSLSKQGDFVVVDADILKVRSSVRQYVMAHFGATARVITCQIPGGVFVALAYAEATKLSETADFPIEDDPDEAIAHLLDD